MSPLSRPLLWHCIHTVYAYVVCAPNTAHRTVTASMRRHKGGRCGLTIAVVAAVALAPLLAVGVAGVTGQWFDHIFIIQFENHSKSEALADPNFAK